MRDFITLSCTEAWLRHSFVLPNIFFASQNPPLNPNLLGGFPSCSALLAVVTCDISKSRLASMQPHSMQPHMGAYPNHSVTTETIQKYLDENKQLILAILDNQNLGKLNECAAYQARLQENLMYLAAIADSQPQQPPVHAQVPQAPVMQPGLHYMAHQQAQQQMAQQSLLAGRNPFQYTQQSLSSLHAQHQQHQQQNQQQILLAQHGINSGGNNSLIGIPSESGMGGNSSLNSGGFPDFGHGGNTGDRLQMSRSLGADMQGNKSDVLSVSDIRHGTGGGNGSTGGGKTRDEPETSYLKGSEEEGN